MIKHKIGKITITEQFESISPAQATDILEKHLDSYQRKERANLVDRINEAIEVHGYHPWYSRVVWSDTKTILDGQHTLRWISRQDLRKKFNVRVVRGVPRSMIPLIGGDVSNTWTSAERLSVELEENILAADLSVVKELEYLATGKRVRNDDQDRKRAYLIWKPIIEHVNDLPRGKKPPRTSSFGDSLQAVGVRAPLILAVMLNEEQSCQFFKEVSGGDKVSSAAKQMVHAAKAAVGQNSRQAGDAFTKENHPRILRAIEVGCGLVKSKNLTPTKGLKERWEKRAAEVRAELGNVT